MERFDTTSKGGCVQDQLAKLQDEIAALQDVTVAPLSAPVKRRVKMLYLMEKVKKLKARVSKFDEDLEKVDEPSAHFNPELKPQRVMKTRVPTIKQEIRVIKALALVPKNHAGRDELRRVSKCEDPDGRYVAFFRSVLNHCISRTMRNITQAADAQKMFGRLTSFFAQTYCKGDFLVRENEPGDVVWLIMAGQCAVVNSEARSILGVLGTGEFVGLTSAVCHTREPNSVVVVSATVQLLGLSRSDIHGLPAEVGLALAQVAESHNQWHLERLQLLQSNTLSRDATRSTQRTADQFRLDQSAFLSGKHGEHITAILNHFKNYQMPETTSILSRSAAFFVGVTFGDSFSNTANVGFNTVREDLREQKQRQNTYLNDDATVSSEAETMGSAPDAIMTMQLAQIACKKDVPLHCHSNAMRAYRAPPDLTLPVVVSPKDALQDDHAHARDVPERHLALDKRLDELAMLTAGVGEAIGWQRPTKPSSFRRTSATMHPKSARIAAPVRPTDVATKAPQN